MDAVVDRRRFNPLIDYLNDLPEWDGVERIETILIDYLGASDNQYVREVTKRTLIGAVRRAYEPGCKFDYVLVLDGKPGIGKSTLLSTLGGEFFSDSLSLTDTRDKTAAEKLQGIWIMGIGEEKKGLGILYCGGYGRRVGDDVMLCMNFYYGEETFALPSLPKDRMWFKVTNTSEGEFYQDGQETLSQQHVTVPGGSVTVLIGKKVKETKK
jgi:hypothetical protein